MKLTMAKQYELNEKDIDTVLNILKRNDPEHATPEWAIRILEHLYTTLDDVSFDDPERLDRIIEDASKKLSS